MEHRNLFANLPKSLPDELIDVLAENIDDPLPRIGNGQLVDQIPIVQQLESNLRISQYYFLKFSDNMLEFDRVFFQKLSASRNIIEKVFD